jgi:hypothetical protein
LKISFESDKLKKMKLKVSKNILLLVSLLVNIQFTNGKEYMTSDAVIVEGVLILTEIKKYN